jgi:hypothetical protein
MTDFDIRAARGSDLNFIFDTFKLAMKFDSMLGKSVKPSVFNREFPKVIDFLLEHGETIVACLKEDPHIIVGYMIYEPETVHFIFVKQVFRRMGVAKALIQKAFGASGPTTYTNKTKSIRKFIDNFPIEHNPFILMKQGVTGGERKIG